MQNQPFGVVTSTKLLKQPKQSTTQRDFWESVLGAWEHIKASAVPQQEGAELSSHPTSHEHSRDKIENSDFKGLLPIPCISNHEETQLLLAESQSKSTCGYQQ